jgi:pimeloyl-ACP methyl ester carboxylesterase
MTTHQLVSRDRIAAPTLIAWGDRDTIMPARTGTDS